MGGRGASGTTKNKLPNHKNAVILHDKTNNYILNPSKSPGKAKFFNGIGYNIKNSKLLDKHIRAGLNNGTVDRVRIKSNGDKSFQVVMTLGVTRKEKVLTVWQIDKGSKIPRFITAYKYDKE